MPFGNPLPRPAVLVPEGHPRIAQSRDGGTGFCGQATPSPEGTADRRREEHALHTLRASAPGPYSRSVWSAWSLLPLLGAPAQPLKRLHLGQDSRLVKFEYGADWPCRAPPPGGERELARPGVRNPRDDRPRGPWLGSDPKGKRQRLSSHLGRAILECGGKRSATPPWLGQGLTFPGVPGGRNPDSSGRFALLAALSRRRSGPAHSNGV